MCLDRVGDTSAKTLSEREGREKRHREKEGDEEEGGKNKEEGGIEEQKEGGGEKEEGGEEKKNEGGEKKEGWKEKTDEREEEKEEEGGKNKEEGGIEEKNERWKETKEGGGEMKEERGEMKEEGGEKKDEREEEKRNGDEEEEMEEKEEETKEEEGEKKKEGGEKKKEEDNVKKKKKEGEEELLKENVAPVSLALPGQQVCTDSFNHKVNDISSTSSTSSSFSSSSPLPVFLPRHIIMDKDDRQKSSMPLLLLLPHDTKSPSSSLSQEKTREKNSTSSFSRLLEREEEIETPLSTLSSISESRGEKRGEEEEEKKKKKVQEKEHTVSLVYKMKESLSTQQEEKIKSSPSPGETLESSLGTSSSVKETEMGEEKEDEKKEEEETKEEEEEEKKEEEGEKKEEEIDKDTPLMTAEDTSKSSRCDTSVFPSSSTPLSPSSSSPLSNRRTATASSSSSSPPSGVLPSSLVRHTSSCPPNRRNYREEKGSRRAEEEEEKKGREDGEERKEERSNDLKEKLARSNTRCTRGLGVNSPLSPSSSSSLPSMSYQEKRRRTPSSSSSLLSSPSTPSLKRRPTTREKNRSKGLSVSLSPSCRKLCKGRTSPSPLNTKLMRKTQGLSPSSSSSLQTMKPSSTSQNSRCKKDGRSAQILRRREQEKRKDRGSLHIHGNLCNGVESASASSPSSSSSSSSSLSEEKRIESKESSNFLKKIEVFETPWLRVRLTNIPLKHQWKAHLNYEDKVEFLIKNGIAQTTCFRREAPSSLTICKQYDWKNHQAMFEDEDRTTFYRNALCWRGWKKYEAKRKEQQKRRLHAEGCRKTEEETGVSLSMTNRFEDLLSQPKKIDLLSSPAEAHLQQKGVGKRDEGEGGKRREEEERQGRQMMGTVEDRGDREETSERKEESSRRGEKREDSHSKKKRRSSPFLSMRSKRRRVKPQGMTTECPTERREREGRSSQRRLPEHRSLEHRFVEDFPTEEERFSSRSLIWGFSCRSLTDENACSSSLTGKDQESEDTAASDKEKDSQRNVKSFIVERPHELEEEKEGNVDEGNTEKDPTSHPAPSPYSSSSSSSSPSSLHSPSSSSFAPSSSCSSSSSSSLSPCPSSSSSFPSSSSLHSSSSSPSSSSSSSSSSSRAFVSLGDGDEGERVAKERDEVFSSSTPISNALSLGRNVLHSPLQSLDKPQREASSLPLPLDQLAPTTSMHIDSSSSSVSSSSSFSSTSLSDPLLSSSSSLLVSSSPLHNDVKTEISLLSHTKGPCLSSLPCMHALGCHSLDRQTDESLFQHRVETSPSSLKEQRKYIESTDEEVETSTSDEDEEEENRRRALPLSGDEEDEEEFVDDGAIDHISRSSSRKSRGPFKTDSQLKKEKNLKKKKNKKEEKRKKKRKTFVEGKRILEIGTGPIALLAILALKAGAEYVDALEVSRSSASLATAFVRQFGINSAYSRYQKKNRGSSFLSSSSSSSCSSSSSPSTSSSSEDESEDENIKTGGSFCKKEEKESFLLNTANLFGSNSLTPTNPIHTDISSSPSSFEICTAPAAGSLPSNVSRGSSSVHRKEEHTACTDVKAQESQGDACKRTPQLSSSSSSPSRSSSSLVLLKKRKRGESVKKKKRERHLSSSSSSSSLSSSSTSSRLCIHHCYSKLFPLPPPHLEPKFYRQHTFPHFFKSSSPLSSSLLPSPSPLPPSSSPSPLPLSSSPSPLPASSPPFPPSSSPPFPPSSSSSACSFPYYYDVVVHEILGDFASQEGAADVYLDLQERLGYCPRSIPTAATTCVSPCTFPTPYNVKYKAAEHPERTIFSPRKKLFQSVGLQFSSLLLCDYLLPLEELRFEESMHDQMLQHRELRFTVTRGGKFAGLLSALDVEIRPGKHFGTVYEGQCDSWYTNVILIGKEIAVLPGDKIVLFTVADLKNYQLENVYNPSGGKKRQSTSLRVSRPSYRFEGYVERRRKGIIDRFKPILIDYDEQASCIQIK